MVPNSQICPEPENSLAERRSHPRYTVELEVRCAQTNSSVSLVGTTRDMSSHGICFKVNSKFAIGTELKLSVFWPFLLENIRPLQLVVWGRVMRANGDGTAVKIHRHEFRIRAINGSAELMPMIRGQSSGP